MRKGNINSVMKLLVDNTQNSFLPLHDQTLHQIKQKSHTCKEGGVDLKISFWHLLMNLKNKQVQCSNGPLVLRLTSQTSQK